MSNYFVKKLRSVGEINFSLQKGSLIGEGNDTVYTACILYVCTVQYVCMYVCMYL